MNVEPQPPSQSDSTSVSLLRRLRSQDAEAWERLTRIYGPLVYRWCRRAGVDIQDVGDVAQEVFRAVHSGINKFRRERQTDSFRGWLFGITRNKTNDHFRNQVKHPRAVGGTEMQVRIGREIDFPSDETDLDDRTLVLHRALDVIRGDFDGRSWSAFWRTTLEQQSSTDVAHDLGMTANAVRQAKFRVLRRLRCELEDLDNVDVEENWRGCDQA